MAARGWSLFSLYICIENLKKSSCQKPLDRFQYTLAEMFLWWPFTKIVQAVMICQKIWPPGGGAYFPYIYVYRKLEKTSCQKPLDRFQYNLADMFPWWPFTKIVQAIMICQKTWLVGGGAYITRISTQKTLMIFLSETTGLISIKHCRNVSYVTLYQGYASRHDLSRNRAARGRGLFSLYIYIEKV